MTYRCPVCQKTWETNGRVIVLDRPTPRYRFAVPTGRTPLGCPGCAPVQADGSVLPGAVQFSDCMPRWRLC